VNPNQDQEVLTMIRMRMVSIKAGITFITILKWDMFLQWKVLRKNFSLIVLKNGSN